MADIFDDYGDDIDRSDNYGGDDIPPETGKPNPDHAWGVYLEGCRLTSKFSGNLSAAARAVEISPSDLHKIEGGDVIPTPDLVVQLLNLYGTVPPVMCACGRDLRAGERLPVHPEGEADHDNTPPAVKDFDQAAFFLQYPPPDIPEVDWELVCPTVEGDYYLELVNGRWTKQPDGSKLHGLGLRAIPRQRKARFTETPGYRCKHCCFHCSRPNASATCPLVPPEPAKAAEATPQKITADVWVMRIFDSLNQVTVITAVPVQIVGHWFYPEIPLHFVRDQIPEVDYSKCKTVTIEVEDTAEPSTALKSDQSV